MRFEYTFSVCLSVLCDNLKVKFEICRQTERKERKEKRKEKEVSHCHVACWFADSSIFRGTATTNDSSSSDWIDSGRPCGVQLGSSTAAEGSVVATVAHSTSHSPTPSLPLSVCLLSSPKWCSANGSPSLLISHLLRFALSPFFLFSAISARSVCVCVRAPGYDDALVVVITSFAESQRKREKWLSCGETTLMFLLIGLVINLKFKTLAQFR